MRWNTLAATVVLASLAACPAAAQVLPPPPPAVAPTPPAATRVWYGWQTLLVLAGSGALVGLGVAVASASERGSVGGVMAAFGGIGVTMAGSIVHTAHGHIGRGAAALGLNYGLALAGGLIGLGVDVALDRDDLGLMGLLVGSYAGLATALVIDVAAVSYDEAPAPRPQALRLAPDLRLSSRGAVLGVLGEF